MSDNLQHCIAAFTKASPAASQGGRWCHLWRMKVLPGRQRGVQVVGHVLASAWPVCASSRYPMSRGLELPARATAGLGKRRLATDGP